MHLCEQASVWQQRQAQSKMRVLAVLKIGLTLSDQPSELAGILTGALLLAVLAGEAVIKKLSARRARIGSATVSATNT